MEEDTNNPSRQGRRHVYPISLKKQAVALRDRMSIREIGDHIGVHYSNVRNWLRVSNKLSEFKGNKKSSNMIGSGRPRILPEPNSLLAFMDARRHQERALTCSHMVNFLKKHHQPWLQAYIARQPDGNGYDNLLRLLQRFCARHGYTYQQACNAKRTITDLESTRAEFAARFYSDHGDMPDDCVYNVDETGIQYDMPPRYIWSKIGGTPKLSTGEKHSYRMTAVLTIRRDGEKLPILFVIKGQPGGRIDKHEVPTFPEGHFYTMQSKAWMDGGVWQQYLWWVLAERVTKPSLLVLDNFDSHVSEEGVATASEIGYEVCPLPANATSHCQPLDVSIMAPFKRHLRDLWIAEDTVEHDDEDDQDWMSPAARVKRSTMIKRAIMAWEKITPEQVRASFLKAIPKPE
ncbi:Aste57867_24913 [Aphanomyces stellatus]|uniref:Aste57867_24913 protein n=1 Tax=Aphanomyces stellatus TaxID=120398 RepID=A0A485LTT4_9STRA|nr:hypothetical protein As57867_024835 [Aphanomyces stellatus]VFU01545.1 Aste57867_24913 [Aphanomyces stellatus]